MALRGGLFHSAIPLIILNWLSSLLSIYYELKIFELSFQICLEANDYFDFNSYISRSVKDFLFAHPVHGDSIPNPSTLAMIQGPKRFMVIGT